MYLISWFLFGAIFGYGITVYQNRENHVLVSLISFVEIISAIIGGILGVVLGIISQWIADLFDKPKNK